MSSVPEKRRGLGRGLEVLVGGFGDGPELAQLPVDQIHPNPRQPRRRFEPEARSGLAESIEAQGIVQPVVVRPRAGRRLRADRRRAPLARGPGGRASQGARARPRGGRPHVAPPGPRRERRARAAVAGRGGARLRDPRGRVRASASARSPTVSAARSRPSPTACDCSSFPDDVLWMIARGELTEGHAKAVLSAPGQAERRRLAKRVVKEGLSVRATERAARVDGRADVPDTQRSRRPGSRRADRARDPAHHRLPAEVTADAGRDPLRATSKELAELAEALERASLMAAIRCRPHGRLAQSVRAPL